MDSFQNRLEIEPTFPEGFPPWLSIPLPIQEATGFCDPMPALPHRQVIYRDLRSIRHHFDYIDGQDFVSGTVWVLSGQRLHLQQAHRQWPQKAEEGS